MLLEHSETVDLVDQVALVRLVKRGRKLRRQAWPFVGQKWWLLKRHR